MNRPSILPNMYSPGMGFKLPKFLKGPPFHEGGHAIGAVALGLQVDYVSIFPDYTRGNAEWYSTGQTKLLDFDYGSSFLLVLFAGIEAQRQHCPTSLRRASAFGDMEIAKERVFFPSTCEWAEALQQEYWNRLKRETRLMMLLNRRAVAETARALRESGRITGQKVEEIFAEFGAGPFDYVLHKDR